MRLEETPIFSRVKITAAGSINIAETTNLLRSEVISWTSLEPSDDLVADVDVRGVLVTGSELHWMAGDAEVQMIELPHYAGMPKDLISKRAPSRAQVARRRIPTARMDGRHSSGHLKPCTAHSSTPTTTRRSRSSCALYRWHQTIYARCCWRA